MTGTTKPSGGGNGTENSIEGGVIDCDIHNSVPSVEALHPYLSDQWRDYVVERGIQSLEPNYYPRGAAISSRPDFRLDSGDPPGSDLDVLRRQALDKRDTEYAILNCLYGVQLTHNEDWAAAMARAVNDWQTVEWLDKEPRLRASIVVPYENPQLAVEEIERLGDHPGFVQVLLLVRTDILLGRRNYWPIYEAAQKYGLPVGIHAFGRLSNPNTPVGWASYYLEDYVSQAQAFQAQLVSLVSEGVFTKFPELRVVLIESGFTWLPSLMWRFDKDWKGLRKDAPWVERLPSEIIREHVRLTTQPVDGPSDPEHLLQMVEEIGSEELLLFSTDYPHWHFDELEGALPVELHRELEQKILRENAQNLYQFEKVPAKEVTR